MTSRFRANYSNTQTCPPRTFNTTTQADPTTIPDRHRQRSRHGIPDADAVAACDGASPPTARNWRDAGSNDYPGGDCQHHSTDDALCPAHVRWRSDAADEGDEGAQLREKALRALQGASHLPPGGPYPRPLPTQYSVEADAERRIGRTTKGRQAPQRLPLYHLQIEPETQAATGLDDEEETRSDDSEVRARAKRPLPVLYDYWIYERAEMRKMILASGSLTLRRQWRPAEEGEGRLSNRGMVLPVGGLRLGQEAKLPGSLG